MSDQCPYYPTPREHPFHPSSDIATFRNTAPVVKARTWNGQEVWLATRYAEVHRVLKDHETFSQVPGPGYPTVSPGRGSTVYEEIPTFVRMDPPEHTSHRKMITADFTMKRVNELRPKITKIADALIDAMIAKGPPADLVTDFALPLPTTVITEYLGLPIEDSGFIQAMSSQKLNLEVDGQTARAAQLKLQAYLGEQLRRKEADLDAGDVTAKLLRDYVLTGRLGRDEAVGLIELLVSAGHETTANMLALGTLTLLQHSEELEKLRNDRSLIGSAVNELMRFLTVNQNVGGRVCVKDTELGGERIRAGEGVFALLQSANRDEAVFSDADRFDVTRNPVNQMGFGYGAHQCVGLTLAKAEMEVAFGRLLDRLPRMALAVPFDDLRFKNEAVVFGVRSLPIIW
jgi:cytochrome P450